jgi:chemotaxis protein methyltransferase CheR
MLLAEADLTDWQVYATDISTAALARTRAGRYQEKELSGLSPDRLARYFQPVGDDGRELEIIPALREKVHVSRHNLAADAPPFPPGTCQIVLCRNVLIYFNRAEVLGVLDRLAQWLPPNGYLFLGYSESLWQVTDRFALTRIGAAFVYRNGPRRPSAPAAPTAPLRLARRAPRDPEPRGPRPAPPARPPTVPQPTVTELLAQGELALGARDYSVAVAAFRKAAYLDPDQPVAHLNLALALEAAGDDDAARRAYLAARAAIARCDTALVEATLEGYHLDELTRLLDLKVGAP